MNFVPLIERKRDGGELTDEEILWLISEYAADRIPDYQMSSMLMAVFKEGLNTDELAVWTSAMLHSGSTLDLSGLDEPKVDKHSTGGVGDKVSIPLAPIVAACGASIPMMSGRGLGHTGGTLDKLETIPGFRTVLDPPEFTAILKRTGLVLAGQSESLVPADRRMYALRDVTGTVPSIPLIASSIMSKKLAEDLDALILDVKVGSGAFKREIEDARVLAQTMVDIGRAHNTPVTAFITDMNQPLGEAVGHANEIAESVEVLRGGGPPDLIEIVMRLGTEMLLAGGIATDADDARQRLQGSIEDGSAFEKLIEVTVAQGGDPSVLEDTTLLPIAPNEFVVSAERSGLLRRADARDIGVAALRLGAGREIKEDEIDTGVGIVIPLNVGDPVSEGDPLAIIRWREDERLASCLTQLEQAFEVADEPVDPLTLVKEVIR